MVPSVGLLLVEQEAKREERDHVAGLWDGVMQIEGESLL